MGIEIRGRDDNHVTGRPASGVQDFNGVAAGLGGLGQLRPGVRPIPVQVQGSAHQHDPAVTAVIPAQSTEIFAFDVVREGNGRLVRVGFGFRANLQLPVQHDPLSGQFKIFVIREAQFAVDRQTAQRRRRGIKNNVHIPINGDSGVWRGHLLVSPSGCIGPAAPLDRRRRRCLLSLKNGISAEAQNGRDQQGKEQEIMFSHG